MQIKTEVLQKMVAKAIQGSSMNKMIPLTSLIGIKVKRDLLTPDKSIITLTTTDGSNQLNIHETITNLEDFYTIVDAGVFAKLVGKTTEEFIELENKENYLLFIGNGTYKLDIAINEEGEMVKFPEIQTINTEPYSISTELLQNSIKVAKSSISKTMEVPCLTGYYISDKTITTDRQLVCNINIGLSKEPLLISSEIAELILLIDTDPINILHKDNNLIIFTNDITISGKELEGKELYPVQAIEGLTKLEYSNNITVNKQELLNVLDRMSLFISDYDKNGIKLAFAKDGLCITSQKSNAQELIDAECNVEEEYNCLVDIEMLKSQIETVSTDKVEIQYGQEKSIKIVDGNVTHIISLLTKTN